MATLGHRGPMHSEARQATQAQAGGAVLDTPHAPLTAYARYMAQAGFRLVARTPGHGPESDWERQFYVVEPGNDAPRDHAWATARFAADAMADHAYLLATLLPVEAAAPQRGRALLLARQYRRLAQHVDVQGPPPSGEVRAFTRQMAEELEPLIALKQECLDLQSGGALRSLAWPTLLDHLRREAEHWEDRLGRIGSGDLSVEPRTARFWGHVLAEHAQFTAHLLDPGEQREVRAWTRRSEGLAAATGSLEAHHGHAAGELAAVLELAGESVSAATEAARAVEAVRVQGILTPMLADHWRREAIWAVEELRRAAAP